MWKILPLPAEGYAAGKGMGRLFTPRFTQHARLFPSHSDRCRSAHVWKPKGETLVFHCVRVRREMPCCGSHSVDSTWHFKKTRDLFNLNSVTSHFHIKVLRAHFLRLHHFLLIYGRVDTICEWQGYFKFYLFSILLNIFILISSSL